MGLWIGLMSGTSLDGIDAALVRIEPGRPLSLIDTLAQPFSAEFQQQLQNHVSKPAINFSDYAQLDVELARLSAQAVLKLQEQARASHKMESNDKIEGVASHGLTLFHAPNSGFPMSLQIGDPHVIAYQTKLPVIADFRRMDIAAGGQGAPFAPMFHRALLPKQLAEPVAVVNIGGIANVSLLSDEQVLGFDTGPGNGLMNRWIYRHRGLSYDDQGQWAASGDVDEGLLNKMLSDAYFSRPAPKSTGAEYFNERWIDEHLKHHPEVSVANVQATLLELTAVSIANELAAANCQRAFFCGGGVHNQALMQSLEQKLERTECQVQTTQTLGIHPDWVEAAGFAWLGYARWHKKNIHLPNVTGADEQVLLGAIYQA